MLKEADALSQEHHKHKGFSRSVKHRKAKTICPGNYIIKSLSILKPMSLDGRLQKDCAKGEGPS